MATGEGGNAPGTAGPLLHGAEFLGVVELDTELGFEGTLTGWDGVGCGGGAGTAGLMKGWLKNVSKSIRILASRFSSPLSKFASSAEVPLGILNTKEVLLLTRSESKWPFLPQTSATSLDTFQVVESKYIFSENSNDLLLKAETSKNLHDVDYLIVVCSSTTVLVNNVRKKCLKVQYKCKTPCIKTFFSKCCCQVLSPQQTKLSKKNHAISSCLQTYARAFYKA